VDRGGSSGRSPAGWGLSAGADPLAAAEGGAAVGEGGEPGPVIRRRWDRA
jgi:hypothetical protein